MVDYGGHVVWGGERGRKFDPYRLPHERPAQAIEAAKPARPGTGLDPKGESAVAEGHAPQLYRQTQSTKRITITHDR